MEIQTQYTNEIKLYGPYYSGDYISRNIRRFCFLISGVGKTVSEGYIKSVSKFISKKIVIINTGGRDLEKAKASKPDQKFMEYDSLPDKKVLNELLELGDINAITKLNYYGELNNENLLNLLKALKNEEFEFIICGKAWMHFFEKLRKMNEKKEYNFLVDNLHLEEFEV